jgi:hypothetical protein
MVLLDDLVGEISGALCNYLWNSSKTKEAVSVGGPVSPLVQLGARMHPLA